MPTIPQKATTIILLRDSTSKGFEVFLLKRHEKSSFMGGNYVYPGGRIDKDDPNLEICVYSRGVSPEKAQQILGGMSSPEESFAYWIAGIRELFEEAGVLLASSRQEDPFTLKNQEEKDRFSNYRDLLQKGKMTLCQLAQEEKLLLDLGQMYYYAHWITPEARTQRFDTYFFIARHPAGQEAIHDQKETTAGIWITPRAALEENLTGEVVLSPPTLKTLEDLARFETIDAIFDSLKNKEITPVLPILTTVSGDTFILFPWDPEYERFQKAQMSGPVDHGKPSLPTENSTRVVLRQGRWHPFCKS